MAIASLVLGIIGMFLAIIPWISILGIIVGIVTIIMAAINLSQSMRRGFIPHKLSKIGLILGIVAVGVGAIVLFVTALYTIEQFNSLEYHIERMLSPSYRY